MKRMILIIGILLAASFVVAAPNEALIDQAGNSNDGTVSQSGSNNKADLHQSGSNNGAYIDQTGNDNRVGAPQAGDAGLGAYGESDDISLAKGVMQEGNRNTVVISQDGRNNVVQQFRQVRGVLNSVYQKGDRNNFSIEQVGNNNVIGQASSEYDGLDQKGSYNSASIAQEGNGNKLTYFFQKDNNNRADIIQQGNNNVINSATQTLLGSSPAANELDIVQYGNDNKITNAGEEGKNIDGWITQEGHRNEAGMQLSRTAAWGDIDQVGNDNEASLIINKSYIGNGNTGDIDQIGHFNVASQKISQADNSITSSSNEMITYQEGNYNEAEIVILGSSNFAEINQTGVGNHIGTITQTGDGNDAEITSAGNGHMGTITQTGMQNDALITQN